MSDPVVYSTMIPAKDGFYVALEQQAASATDNYLELVGSPTGLPVTLQAFGTDANIEIDIEPKGSGRVNLGTNFTNYIAAQGATANNDPTLTAVGSDVNIDLVLRGKGTGGLIAGDNQANYFTLVGAASGNAPSVSVQGTDNTTHLFLTPKGTTGAVYAPKLYLGATQPPGAVFVGSISGTPPVLTVTSVNGGTISAGMVLGGTGVVGSPTISAYGTGGTTGTGGVGTYRISSTTHTALSSRTFRVTTANTARVLNIVYPTSGMSDAALGAVRIGGNVFGTMTGSDNLGIGLSVNADGDSANAPDGYSLVYFGQSISSSSAVGGRTTQSTNMRISTNVASAGEMDYYTAGSRIVTAVGSTGGVHGAPGGQVFGANDRSLLLRAVGSSPGAGMNINSAVGIEIGVMAEDDTQAGWLIGQQIVWEQYNASRGTYQDQMLGFVAQVYNGVGAKMGITFGEINGTWPFNPDSTLIGSTATSLMSRPYTVYDGIDFSRVTFNGRAFRTANAELDGAGNFGGLVTGGRTLQTRDGVTAKTAVVASVVVARPGTFNAPMPTLTIAAPGGAGVTATAVVSAMTVRRVAGIVSAGTGYVAGDLLTDTGGVGTPAVLKVVAVNTTGGVRDLKPIAAYFTGTISDTTLTVTAATYGTIAVGMILDGPGIISGTYVRSLLTGTGGTGTYELSRSYTIAGATQFTMTTVGHTSGYYTTLSSSGTALAGGSGVGAEVTFQWGIAAVTVTNPGTLYAEFPPPLVSTSGFFEEPKLHVTMTATQVPLVLNDGGKTQAKGDFEIIGPFNGGATIKTTKFTYNDSAHTAELQIINTLAGGNAIAARNLSAAGYSAYVARDDNGIERMAIGVGNSGSAQPDVVYWEASYFTGAPHTTPPPTIKIQQTGYMFGSYNQRNRMLFTNDGRIQLIKDDGNAGFVFDSPTSSVAIKTPLATAIANTALDVWATAVFGDTQGARTNAAPSGATNPAIGINHSTGVFMRAIYPNVGTAVVQMTGNTTTRALEFVNTDNSNTVVMSLRLNGSGQVTFGGPIIASSAVGLTATGTTQTDALALTKQKNFVTTVAAGTGVVLPTAITGMTITVFNRGANTLNCYPASGAAINALAANAAKTIAAGASETFTAASATQWYSEL